MSWYDRDMEIYDVIIIGSGPAGLTAGIYASRASLNVLLAAGNTWGGQLMQTTEVENFPGFPEGIMGPELMTRMRKQAERFGTQIVDTEVTKVDFSKRPFRVWTGEKEYSGKAVIVATGAEFKWLGLPSEQRLIGRGVSACATCDAAFFKNKRVIVVGGGDAAMEEAQVLSKFASEVTIVHRRDSFRASKIMQDKVLSNPKIKVKWNTEIEEILGENKVEGVKFKGGETMAADGVFVAIGHDPATKIFNGQINLDEKFYAKREGNEIKTMSNVEGVFIAGDVHDICYRQAITAAAYGCEAALDVEKWLTEKE
jgi:thioredoxin reductase (NADPH)